MLASAPPRAGLGLGHLIARVLAGLALTVANRPGYRFCSTVATELVLRRTLIGVHRVTVGLVVDTGVLPRMRHPNIFVGGMLFLLFFFRLFVKIVGDKVQ